MNFCRPVARRQSYKKMESNYDPIIWGSNSTYDSNLRCLFIFSKPMSTDAGVVYNMVCFIQGASSAQSTGKPSSVSPSNCQPMFLDGRRFV